MRIDSHQHFWYYHSERESWIPDSMAGIRRDFLPPELQPLLEKHNMDGCIAVQANESETETEYLLDQTRYFSFIKAVVGWVDLRANNVEERLAFYAENPLFKGVRHALQAETPEFFREKKFLNGISRLKQFDLTYDLLVLEQQLQEAIELVKRFPEQSFVLDHMAKPQISAGPAAAWTRNIRELASCENVYCKLSGFLTQTRDFKWTPSDFHPFFEILLSCFGEDRLLYGSDWPLCLTAGTYGDTLNIISDFLSGKDKIITDKILGQNAMVFYKLQ